MLFYFLYCIISNYSNMFPLIVFTYNTKLLSQFTISNQNSRHSGLRRWQTDVPIEEGNRLGLLYVSSCVVCIFNKPDPNLSLFRHPLQDLRKMNIVTILIWKTCIEDTLTNDFIRGDIYIKY